MNRTEIRTRQNRSIALVLTILVHIAVIAFIAYGKTGAKAEQTSAKVRVAQQHQLSAKP
jgi:uncharacterized protein with PQ loop repeat